MIRQIVPLLLAVILAVGCVSPVEHHGEGVNSSTHNAAQALLITDASEPLRGKLVHSQTLQDLPGDVSLHFGHHYSYAVRPDGKQMAAIVWPSGEHNRNGELHLIELGGGWKDTVAEGILLDDASDLCYSNDGTLLYWTEPVSTGKQPVFQLKQYDQKGKQARVIVAFPQAFIPLQLRELQHGERLAVYGILSSENDHGGSD
ncbi:hypothetical protein [Brevibacillus sp. H7]|uniref:hypothetical protein n=1 Tax=Brevibacillus sp. H7 TaxID=3349138 RepID=UPI00380B8905